MKFLADNIRQKENIMNKVQIITDSLCDLDSVTRKEKGIDYLKMGVSYEGKDLPASLEWDEYSVDELYGTLRRGVRVFTSQVPPEDITNKFESYLKDNIDIVYIACSASLSASVTSAAEIAKGLKEKYPQASVYCVESLSSTVGQGMLTIEAAACRDKGMSAKEICDYITDKRNYVVHWTTVDDLQYLKRAGRVKATAAFFANVLNLKPVMTSDMNGMNLAYVKVKGRKKAIATLIEHIEAEVINPEEQIVYISHADSYEDALLMKEEVMKRVKFKDCYINYMGPILGASAGPGSLGIFCFGKDRNLLFNKEA